MAKAETKGASPTQQEKQIVPPEEVNKDLPATQSGGAIAKTDDIDYGEDAGAGMEGTDSNSFAIPFIGVLQSTSPQCVEGQAKYIPEARPGMFINTVTNKLYDGKTGIRFVAAAYRRAFLEWGPRQGEGGGFKGEFTADVIAKMRFDKKIIEMEGKLYEPLEGGVINPKRCNLFADTRMHYGLVLDAESGEWGNVLLSLTSTQIKKSKQLMTLLSGVRRTKADGTKIAPPTWASILHMTTVPESNDQGNWFGVKVELPLDNTGKVQDKQLYQSAKEFHDQVMKGLVTANHEVDPSASGSASQGDGF